MGNAGGHQCKVKMNGSEKKVNENTYDISSIKRVTKKFLEVWRECSRANNGKEMYKKSVLHVQSCFFCLLDLLLFFTILWRCLRRLAFHDFIFFWTNYKYYRELRFQPWLNLCINLINALRCTPWIGRYIC